MLCALFTLALILAGIGVLAFLACQRVVDHARRHPESVKHIVECVIMPLLQRRPDDADPPAEDEAVPPPATAHHHHPRPE